MHKTTLVAALLVASVSAQQSSQQKLHPYLQEQVAKADGQTMLPVYFVIGDRLGYDHWFPRVWSMDIEQRRATVVRELREHAERTQADLLVYLRAELQAGNAADLSSNWLGNFVKVRATPLTVLTAASIAAVSEVWYDHVPPREQVEDADPLQLPTPAARSADLPAAAPAAACLPLPPRNPGNGPTAVKADRVWAFGFEGQGVIVLNADSGIDTAPSFHTDLIQRVWVNTGEIPGNGIDDDNNGYIDDINGWNFGANNNNLNDSGGHGSNTAGCIVADGSCDGVTYGIAPSARLITGALGGESSQWDAIQYAITMGAHTQTSSHSYKSNFNPPPNYKMHRDVGTNSLAAGLIRTNSTSNDGSLCGSGSDPRRRPINISAPGNLPPPYLDPNQTLRGQLGGVLGVAAWNFTSNALMSYSPCGPFAWHLADLQVNVPAYPVANWDPANHNDYPYAGGSQQGLLKPDVSSPTGTRTTSSAPCSFTTFSGTSNATPVANGVLVLWKGANMSLTPEDIAMIVHQTASDRGSVAGKENNWGAGVIDAEAGLFRALCVHRVNGQPAWDVQHSLASGAMAMAIDGVPSSVAAILIGLQRQSVPFGPVNVGVGSVFATLWAGLTNAAGDASASIPANPALAGLTFYSQGFLWDQTHTNRILDSNVIEIRVVP